MRIAVIGAGIVGVSCALHLQRDGHDVTLIDPRAPGTATSFGNAGGIVTGAVVPNSTPALWRDIPRMLFDRDSAVRVRWRYLPQHRTVADPLPARRTPCARPGHRRCAAAAGLPAPMTRTAS